MQIRNSFVYLLAKNDQKVEHIFAKLLQREVGCNILWLTV